MVNISPTLPPSGTFGAFKPQAPQKRSLLPYLVIGAVILILAAGYYFFIYQGIGFSLATPVIPGASPLTSIEIKVAQLPSFQFNVFNSSLYKSLKSYGALPVVADSLGRTNPFIPY
ncbi:MAG: hypothetical protein HYV51_01080 [Parcubacteria group bacterium]|nr:hypothetical protein [Parcubacteria group bacterium]